MARCAWGSVRRGLYGDVLLSCEVGVVICGLPHALITKVSSVWSSVPASGKCWCIPEVGASQSSDGIFITTQSTEGCSGQEFGVILNSSLTLYISRHGYLSSMEHVHSRPALSNVKASVQLKIQFFSYTGHISSAQEPHVYWTV